MKRKAIDVQNVLGEDITVLGERIKDGQVFTVESCQEIDNLIRYGYLKELEQ